MNNNIKEKVKPIRIDKICTNCDIGKMRPDNMVFSSYPPKFSHKCNICGFIETYKRIYPYYKLEDV